MKKGFLIAGIIVSTIALALCVIANAFVISALSKRGSATNFEEALGNAVFSLVVIVIFVISYPGQLVFNIAGIATTAQTLRSESQAIRITGTVFLILNAVMILVSVGMFIAFVTICNSPASETAFVLNSLKV